MFESVSDLNISNTNCCQGGKSSTIRIFVRGIASLSLFSRSFYREGRPSDPSFVSQSMFSCSRLGRRCAGAIRELPWSNEIAAVKEKMVELISLFNLSVPSTAAVRTSPRLASTNGCGWETVAAFKANPLGTMLRLVPSTERVSKSTLICLL